MNLSHFRQEKDHFFKHDSHSPLTPEQRAEFTGLLYYDENPDLRFELDIEEFEDKASIQMLTSTGDLQTYTRFGKIHFQVAGQSAELTVYQSRHGFFLPFVDAQAGVETYGAGRYLDPDTLSDGRLEIDFNLAYNPYCAYNDLYSCPIPPRENRLNVAIPAGEKVFK
ncbi:MAG: DUF1684 domain-containing protein [Chloroflexi bacterium]|nr:DUF1684 domain-containing protein [Chloroflexota bacterium]